LFRRGKLIIGGSCALCAEAYPLGHYQHRQESGTPPATPVAAKKSSSAGLESPVATKRARARVMHHARRVNPSHRDSKIEMEMGARADTSTSRYSIRLILILDTSVSVVVLDVGVGVLVRARTVHVHVCSSRVRSFFIYL